MLRAFLLIASISLSACSDAAAQSESAPRFPQSRDDPGALRLSHAPNDDAQTLVHAWRVDASACTLTLLSDGRVQSGDLCTAPWSLAERWRVAAAPVGTAALQLRTADGVRIWGGARTQDGAYRGRTARGPLVTLTPVTFDPQPASP